MPDLDPDDLTLLAALAGGASMGVVARRSAVSERTTRRRLRAICDRLGVDTPIEAVVLAVRTGLI